MATKTTRPSTPRPRGTRVEGSVQPWSAARERPKTSKPRPRVELAAPGRSKRARWRAGERMKRGAGAAGALQDAGDDQQTGASRQPAEQRGGREHPEGGDEDVAAAEQIAAAAPEQQQGSEGERVAVDDPGDATDAEPEAVLDRG